MNVVTREELNSKLEATRMAFEARVSEKTNSFIRWMFASQIATVALIVGIQSVQFNRIDLGIKALGTEVGKIREDVAGLRVEQRLLKEDVTQLKADVEELKRRLPERPVTR
ncbi:MAG: hypothetical protein ACXU8N_18175 [Telluria sp.]